MIVFLGLLLAIAVEVPVLLLLAARREGPSALGTWALLGVGANCITYAPFAASLVSLRPAWGAAATLGILEALVITIEGVVYATVGGRGLRGGLVRSALANALSFAAGLLVWRIP